MRCAAMCDVGAMRARRCGSGARLTAGVEAARHRLTCPPPDARRCHAQYGSYPLKGKYCHEAALRIVLSCMESHANRHKR
eukprot:3105794-Prymnesium_polylepis.1